MNAPDPLKPEPWQPIKDSWLARVPAPVFVTAYGVVAIAAVVLVVALAGYSANVPTKAVEMEQPRRPFNPAPVNEEQVAASVRSYLIENVEVGHTETGVMLRGDIAEAVSQMPGEFAGHMSRLLDQNCLDTVTLTDPDGMRLNFWGFCFSTVPPTAIEELTAYGTDEQADSVGFADYPQRDESKQAAVNWREAGGTGSLDALVKKWRGVEVPEGIDKLVLTAYGDDEVAVMEKTPRGTNKLTRSPLTGVLSLEEP